MSEIKNPDIQLHRKRMMEKKRVVDAAIDRATEERGILILMKGSGKGKSSSAFGMACRALGHGMRVGVVQCLKGRQDTGEYLFLKDHPSVDFCIHGDGFTWETQNLEQDRASAARAWQECQRMLDDVSLDLLLFDEMSYLLKYHYLDSEPVIAALKQRPFHQHVIITGRTMHRDLEALADTISEVMDIRHAFRAGIKAQKGTEW